MPSVFLVCFCALAACAPFPPASATWTEDTAPPPLLPIDALLAEAGAVPPDPGPAIAARAARLKARAAAIAATPPAP